MMLLLAVFLFVVLRRPLPDPTHAVLATLSHFGRGVAQAARGNVADAETERAAYADARKAIAPESDRGYNNAKDMISPEIRTAAARSLACGNCCC
jgi:hypothetical protein